MTGSLRRAHPCGVVPPSIEPFGRRRRVRSVRTRSATAATADEDLVRALYADHAGPLFGYVLRLVSGDRGRAEDVVQETLLRAWRHPEALDPGRGSIRPWLRTVARHIVVDEERARRSRPREVGEQALTVLASDDGLDRRLVAWEVLDAVNELSADHRAALVETYFRGRSVAEAAQVLGIPPGTVKSRTYYALRALRLLLAERGVNEEEVTW